MVVIPDKPELRIARVDRFGLVTVAFNETLIQVTNLTQINSTVLNVQVTSKFKDRNPLLGFTWATKSFSGKEMRLNVEF